MILTFFMIILLLTVCGSVCPSSNDFAFCVNQEDSLVIAYEKGMLVPSDDSMTYALLERLTGKDMPEQKEHYFKIFNEIVISADGALAEVMGEYCIRWVQKDCAFVLAYLKDNPDMEERYLSYMAYEFLFEEDLLPTFKKELLEHYSGGNLYYVRFFLNELDKMIKTLREEE